MKLSAPQYNKGIIVFVLVAILILASLVKATMDLSKVKKSFRNEMAQRLDFEEKTINLEKGRDALLSEVKTLRLEVLKNRRDLEQAKEELAQEQNKSVQLKPELEKPLKD